MQFCDQILIFDYILLFECEKFWFLVLSCFRSQNQSNLTSRMPYKLSKCLNKSKWYCRLVLVSPARSNLEYLRLPSQIKAQSTPILSLKWTIWSVLSHTRLTKHTQTWASCTWASSSNHGCSIHQFQLKIWPMPSKIAHNKPQSRAKLAPKST